MAAREDARSDEARRKRKSYCFTHTEATINYLCNPLFSPQSVRIVHSKRAGRERERERRGAFRKAERLKERRRRGENQTCERERERNARRMIGILM